LWYGTAPVNRPAGRNGDGPTRPQLLAELIERGDLSPVVVDGVRGERYAITTELPILADAERAVAAERAGAAERRDGAESAADANAAVWTAGRPGDVEPGVAFLAPLDPYVWDRDFLRALHGFDYVWEVYVPEKKRRWGYYVLPILFGDRLVGRIEPRIERKTGTLRILGLWWETGFDPLTASGFVAAFGEALEAHRRFGGMARIALPRTHVHRPFVAALRERRTLEDRP
jgi:uncharacterized protein YcaQ